MIVRGVTWVTGGHLLHPEGRIRSNRWILRMLTCKKQAHAWKQEEKKKKKKKGGRGGI